jgi:hypothetical protein
VKTAWLTYAWEDNQAGDVDYAAQELTHSGVSIKLDRWNLKAGRRLWDQIEQFITDPSHSDGWLLYATQASLGSEPCREEFAYALDRALRSRGGNFPVIALFPASVEERLIPAGIRTRLFVSLTDPDWKERIVAGIEDRQANTIRPTMEPYEVILHQPIEPAGKYVVELRPRAGTWAPFFAAIPIGEKDQVVATLGHGPARRIPGAYMLMSCGETISNDGKWWVNFAGNEATPTQSYFVFCTVLPSILVFGVQGGPVYQLLPHSLRSK